MPTLEPEVRRQLGEYLRDLADQLGLRDWTIEVMHDAPTNPRHGASAHVVYGQRVAQLYFSPGFVNEEPAEQRHTCIHELLHLWDVPIRQYAEEALPEIMGRSAWVAFFEAWRMMGEIAVDSLASALAAKFPLPPWTPPPQAP